MAIAMSLMIAQIDFSDWTKWLIPLMIVGGSVLSSITKAYKDRAERKKKDADNTQVPKMEPPTARPARPSIPVARPRTPTTGPVHQEITRPPQPRPVARPIADPMRAPRPVAAPPLGEWFSKPDEVVIVRESHDVDPPKRIQPEPLPSQHQRLARPPLPSAEPQRQQPRRRRRKQLDALAGAARRVKKANATEADLLGSPLVSSLDPVQSEPETSTPDDGASSFVRPTRAALRHAIIMNEILSPPISLRGSSSVLDI